MIPTRHALSAAVLAAALAPLATFGGQTQAAIDTANGAVCAVVKPFYWEIGTVNGAAASGSVGGSTFTASTKIQIASASKMYYGAYVEQVRAGALSATDHQYMSLSSGYDQFTQCNYTQTVGSCADAGTNGIQDSSTVGKFDYGGGHMQKHAELFMGMASLNRTTLASAMNTQLGTAVAYGSPQLAGGVVTTPTDTTSFLRRVMTGGLELGRHLGEMPVCTLPHGCSTAVKSPIPLAWHYSVGHWVEDDPTGDHSYSSPGAFGYYPWISADKTLYGLVALQNPALAWESVQCGQAIRKAYVTGVGQ